MERCRPSGSGSSESSAAAAGRQVLRRSAGAVTRPRAVRVRARSAPAIQALMRRSTAGSAASTPPPPSPLRLVGGGGGGGGGGGRVASYSEEAPGGWGM